MDEEGAHRPWFRSSRLLRQEKAMVNQNAPCAKPGSFYKAPTHLKPPRKPPRKEEGATKTDNKRDRWGVKCADGKSPPLRTPLPTLCKGGAAGEPILDERKEQLRKCLTHKKGTSLDWFCYRNVFSERRKIKKCLIRKNGDFIRLVFWYARWQQSTENPIFTARKLSGIPFLGEEGIENAETKIE